MSLLVLVLVLVLLLLQQTQSISLITTKGALLGHDTSG